MAENDKPSLTTDLVCQIVCEEPIDQLQYAIAMRSLSNKVRLLLKERNSVRNRSREFRCIKHRMVILSVAHGHDVVQGQTKLFERFQQTGGLVDARRQNHHGALVEDHLQFETEVTNRLQHGSLMRAYGGDYRTTH